MHTKWGVQYIQQLRGPMRVYIGFVGIFGQGSQQDSVEGTYHANRRKRSETRSRMKFNSLNASNSLQGGGLYQNIIIQLHRKSQGLYTCTMYYIHVYTVLYTFTCMYMFYIDDIHNIISVSKYHKCVHICIYLFLIYILYFKYCNCNL